MVSEYAFIIDFQFCLIIYYHVPFAEVQTYIKKRRKITDFSNPFVKRNYNRVNKKGTRASGKKESGYSYFQI